MVGDYHASDDPADAAAALERLAALPYPKLLEVEVLGELLGFPRSVNPVDHVVAPRNCRALAHITRLPPAIIQQVVTNMDGLDAIVRATQRDLEAVAGVGAVRARDRGGAAAPAGAQHLVDRYLNL